jgi:hypothetical protein
MSAAAIIPTVVGTLWILNGHECLLAGVDYRLSVPATLSLTFTFPIGFRVGL